MSKEKVVVTGGAGFIGSHLAKRLLSEGYEVHVIDNFSNGKRENLPEGIFLTEADISSLEEIIPVIENSKYVFHIAALPRIGYSIENPIKTFKSNVDGTVSVLEACRLCGVSKVIYSSSSSIYGDQDEIVLHEEMVPRPQSPYAIQKLQGEDWGRMYNDKYGLNFVSVRYFNVYGSNMDPDGKHALLIPKFSKLMKEGKKLPITGDGSQLRDFTHVNDIIEGTVLAAYSNDTGNADVYNLGYGKGRSIKEVALMFGGEIEYIPRRDEPKITWADNSKAKRVLNWSPKISLEEGIQEFL